MAKTKLRKVTVLLPDDLLRRAQKATKAGTTPTLRRGLELVAARNVYDRLLALQGKVKFGMTWQELRGEE